MVVPTATYRDWIREVWEIERDLLPPNPPPVTTIAWRTWHIGSECIDGLLQRGFQIKESFAHFRESAQDAAILNHVDYETYLPGDILVKVDRMSMANSLELRAPLLDYRLAEFAAGLPQEWKWTPRGGKRILKRAAKSVLPSSVLTRRKQGFVLPMASWLRNELLPFAREAIASSRAGHVIRLDYCQQLLERHARGESGGLERKLWSILCYLLWHEQFAS